MLKPAKKEGVKVSFVNPMSCLINYIMPNRNGATNNFTCEVDITEAEEYIAAKKAEGLKGFGLLHVSLAAYTRMISQRPGINRYIRGQKVYSRNDIQYSLVVKKELKLDAPETCVKLITAPESTIYDIYNDLNQLVDENRKESTSNSMDKAAKALSFIPGVFLKFTVWLLKLLDYFGMLPRFLTILSPFHASMFITSMQSLGIPPIYHHLYDFGNCPVFISIGLPYTRYETQADGSVLRKRYMEMKVVCDERICDGHYYASALKLLRRYLEHPSCLDTPPDKVVEDTRISRKKSKTI